MEFNSGFKGLNAELNPIYHLLALLGVHPIFHISGVRINLEQFYINNYAVPYIDVLKCTVYVCNEC